MSHNTSNGWIKLYRCLLDHSLWLNSTAQQKVVLVTLLMLANHTEKKWEWQGKPYTCKPGQLITSLESLRTKCDSSMTIQNVRSALKRFESMGFISKQSNTHNTLITICNWERYQNDTETGNAPNNMSPTDGQQMAGKRVTTNKNDKECKNERTPYIPQTGDRGGLSKEALRVLRISREIENEYLAGQRVCE